MVLEVQIDGGQRLARVSLKPHAVTVSLDPTPIFTFDRAGRLVGAFIDGRNYKRGLDNRLLEKHSPAAGGRPRQRVRRLLDPDERGDFFQGIRAAVGRVRRALTEGILKSPLQDRAGIWLDRVLSWDNERYEEDRARFLRVYKPVGILPPDQYLSVVLQVTEGCPWNRCAFCAFYRDRPYRVRPQEEFEGHLRDVRAFFGESIGLRRSIFLADANALAMPQEALLRRMDAVREAFRPDGGGPSYEKTYSFLDTFTSARKSAGDYREMAERGLRRVYIGLETGDERLLKALNKPGSPDQAVAAVTAVKAGGVRAGIILMVGAGGERYAEDHVEGTLRAVNAMGLGPGDIVYFSEMVVHPNSDYERWAKGAGVRELSSQEMGGQEAAMRRGFRFVDPAGPPKMATYDIREFLY